MSAPATRIARHYWISGCVQGVGYRAFAVRVGQELGVKGYARNLDDGRVEVYATGTQGQLDELAGRLHQGPRWADVRGVQEQEAAVVKYGGFQIKH
ncbi:MAG: acylphosphatase [Acidobacteria bacterium]|nr:acylphosphatase [Acidobacteriota bacterium]